MDSLKKKNTSIKCNYFSSLKYAYSILFKNKKNYIFLIPIFILTTIIGTIITTYIPSLVVYFIENNFDISKILILLLLLILLFIVIQIVTSFINEILSLGYTVIRATIPFKMITRSSLNMDYQIFELKETKDKFLKAQDGVGSNYDGIEGLYRDFPNLIIAILGFLIFGLKNTEINLDCYNDSTVSQKQYILIEQNNNYKNNLDINSFIEHYDFYQYKVGNIDYFVADTLNSEKFIENIVHIKIINNPDLYRFETDIDYKDKFVLELLTMNNDLLEKHYYILSGDDYNKIKRKVLPLNNKKIKNNIITELNIEYDFKSKENSTSINRFDYFGADNSPTNSQLQFAI